MGISYSKDSKNSIVKNKQQQLSNSKIERLFVTSIIKFDIVFVILSGYWEHYPSRVNCVTFSVTLMSLEISSITYLPHPSCTWDKNFDPHTPWKKNSQVAAKLWCSFFGSRMSVWRLKFAQASSSQHICYPCPRSI